MSLAPSLRSAPEIQASVISGGSAVFAEVRPEPFRFAFMTVSHADDASGRPAGSPDKNDESSVEPTNRHETRLAVVAPIVNACEVKARKDLACTAHVGFPVLQRLGTFRRIAGDAQELS